jgi:periplasmic divalent cation tolerance protein
MTDAIIVYVTCPDFALAQRIGRSVVEERIAACANILPGMNTVYRWEGKIEIGQETVLFVKTTAEQFERVAAHIRAAHPYQCPCIIALPVSHGTPDYISWIVQNSNPSIN